MPIADTDGRTCVAPTRPSPWSLLSAAAHHRRLLLVIGVLRHEFYDVGLSDSHKFGVGSNSNVNY